MIIAVISDIHANLRGLRAVADSLERIGPDRIVCLGDIVMLGPEPEETFTLMESLKPDIWIRGNTDAWLDEINEDWVPPDGRMATIKEAALWCRPRLSAAQWDFLASLPIARTLETEENGETPPELITFCHGSPSSFSDGILPENSPEELDELLKDMPAESRTLVTGHTHTRFQMHHRGIDILNFGSVSIPRDYGPPGLARFGIIKTGENLSFHATEASFDFAEYLNRMEGGGFPAAEMIMNNIKLGTR